MVFVRRISLIQARPVNIESKMKKNHEFKIYAMVLFGLALYVGTFIIAWNSTEAYRANINRPLSSNSATVQNSLKLPDR